MRFNIVPHQERFVIIVLKKKQQQRKLAWQLLLWKDQAVKNKQTQRQIE